MLRRLVGMIEAVAARRRRVLWTAVAFTVLLGAMLALGKPFERATGHPPLDFQDTLTVADVEAQVPRYHEQARRIYVAISVLDFAFPPVAALLWASLVSAGLRAAAPRWYAGWRSRGWLALPFLGTLADWIENVANLCLVASAPRVVGAAATLSVYAKQVKVATVTPSAIAGLAMLVAGLAAAAFRSRGAPRGP